MQADTFCFDGDAALALEVHGVEDLFVHFALRESAGHFEKAVGERGFAVVDVRDDAEIPYELRIHFPRFPVFSIAGSILSSRVFSLTYYPRSPLHIPCLSSLTRHLTHR